MSISAPGRFYTFTLSPTDLVDLQMATGTPKAAIVKIGASNAVEEIVAEQVMTLLDDKLNTWYLRVQLPTDADLETYIMCGTVEINSLDVEFAKGVNVMTDTMLESSYAGFDITKLGGFMFQRVGKATRDIRRLLEASLAEIPQVEVEGLVVIFDTVTITQGDTPDFLFRIFNKGTRIVRDITGAVVRFTARSTPTAPLIFDKTCSLTDPIVGVCEVRLLAVDTATVGKYDAEIKVTFPDGSIITAMQFVILIRDSVG